MLTLIRVLTFLYFTPFFVKGFKANELTVLSRRSSPSSNLSGFTAFTDEFKRFRKQHWTKKNNIWDSSARLSYLDKECIKINKKENVVEMDASFNPRIYNGKVINFATPAFRTKKTFGHGCYEMNLKPALSTATYRLYYEFFLYAEGDAPGFGYTKNKIDIILGMGVDGKNMRVRTKAYSSHSSPTSYTDHFPASNLEDDYHRYGIKWTADKVEFFLDGRRFREFDMRDMKEFTLPLRVWHGMYGNPWRTATELSPKRCRLETTTKLDYFKYIPGADCKL